MSIGQYEYIREAKELIENKDLMQDGCIPILKKNTAKCVDEYGRNIEFMAGDCFLLLGKKYRVVDDDYFLLTKVSARKNSSTKKDMREFGRIKARGRK